MSTESPPKPLIIQGGMGIGVSNWQLARAVSLEGQLGVVSGTALSIVLAERLRRGDPGGHMQRAMRHFPDPGMVQEIMDAYFVADGEKQAQPTRSVPMFRLESSPHLLKLTVVANFCEVYLAKEGHAGLVGINYLEKIQLPHLPSLYGAMLAGVDYVLMGAGIPREIPAVLDQLARHQPVSYKIAVEGAHPDDDFRVRFDPGQLMPGAQPSLKRPKFIAIISSATLAMTLARKCSGRVDGFVVESPEAGGHNAPPRGGLSLNELGEPVYGERDQVDTEKIKALGLPFWMAGGYASPRKLAEALALGASGIQAGTVFALCRESGLAPGLRRTIIEQVMTDRVRVFTDPLASPTGFPFKVIRLEGTLSEESVYQERPRLCQLGFLRKIYKRPDGTLGYRCPGEPVADYVAKGGHVEDTPHKKCLCNALMANIGLEQRRSDGYTEKPLVTCGSELETVKALIDAGSLDYSARDILGYLNP